MSIAIICRGVPGSGKSTLTNALEQLAAERGLSCSVHSTDSKFMVDGVYQFDRNLLYRYHMQNLEDFKKSLAGGTDIVICDNTNIKARDYRDYVADAKVHGANVIFVNFVSSSVQEHVARNTHNVPAETIERMIASLKAAWNVPDATATSVYDIQPDQVNIISMDSLVREILDA